MSEPAHLRNVKIRQMKNPQNDRLRLMLSAIFVLLVGCENRPLPITNASPIKSDSNLQDVAAQIGKGDCDGADRTLQTFKLREPLWYEFMSQVNLCRWRRTHMLIDAERALGTLEDGLRQFPDSANLWLSKGYRHEELDAPRAALRDYERAASILRDRAKYGSRPSDQNVLRGTQDAISTLNEKLASGTIQRKPLDQEIFLLLSLKECEEVLAELDSVTATDRNDRWFDLNYTAGTFCYNERHEQRFRERADAALTEGRRRFTNSPLLLIDAAQDRDRAGDANSAIVLYRQALSEPNASDLGNKRDAAEKRLRILEEQRNH